MSFFAKIFEVNFESHKLLKAVFDVIRCALSNETNPERIHWTDVTKLSDLAEHVLSSWKRVPSKKIKQLCTSTSTGR